MPLLQLKCTLAYKIFDAAMMDFHGMKDLAVVTSYDFSAIRKLVDIGGGKGGLISTILKGNSTLKGILFDLPPVIAEAHQPVGELADRLERVAGNFFESVPTGGDGYILKHVIHDWDDEQALIILKNCRKAIAENGKLLLVESVIPPGNDRCPANFLDLHMLAVTGGMERTEAEYRQLFVAAGFKLTQIIPTPAGVHVLEGIAL